MWNAGYSWGVIARALGRSLCAIACRLKKHGNIGTKLYAQYNTPGGQHLTKYSLPE
jgi:hypothetical protein